MNFEKVKDNFGTWAELLKSFITTDEMDKIILFLRKRAQTGKTICPHHTDIFRAFSECPLNKLKCVIMGQDPYHTIDKEGNYAADGIAFSNGHLGKLQPSLSRWYDAIEDDLCGGMSLKMIREPDLTFLANQGVLLLNSSLSCEQGDPGVHNPFIDLEAKTQTYIWKPFLDYLFAQLNLLDPLVFVFMGKQAQRYANEPVPFHHSVLRVEHPIAGVYQQQRPWEHQRVFSRINHLLSDRLKIQDPIKWYKEHP